MKHRITNHYLAYTLTRKHCNKKISSIPYLGINSDIPRSCPYNKQGHGSVKIS